MNAIMALNRGRDPPGQNTKSPCGGSLWPWPMLGSRVPTPSTSPQRRLEHLANGRCRDLLSAPTHVTYAVSSQTSLRSTPSLPSATDAHSRVPAPSAPLGRELRQRTCLSWDLPWLHPIW